MAQFRKRPVVIEAVQFTGENFDEIAEFAFAGESDGCAVQGGKVIIATPEGEMAASPGDWVIRGVKGEFYPCKPDIFSATYEPA